MPNSPFMVAELSCNHLGSLSRARALIEAAWYAGADAVKLQCWHPDRMCVDKNYRIEGTKWAGQKLYDLYQAAFTPWEWFPKLFDCARDLDIECFASVFDTEALSFLENLNCPRYKIASFEITDLPLIRAVATTGKPIVLSTGMATISEISRAQGFVFKYGRRWATLLKCTSAYPAPISEANLVTMPGLGSDVGLSDHTLGSTVAIAATVLGAAMIEKHFTLRRADGGPDAAFSAEPQEFKAMVQACREAKAALGEARYGPTEAERPSLVFRRSLYVRRPIPKGMVLTPEVIDSAIVSSRPALGLPPGALIEGKRVTCDLPVGAPLTEADVAG